MTPLWKLDAVSLIDTFSDGLSSPCDALAETLERVNGLQSTINAFSYQNDDVEKDAIASEQRWARKKAMGPLDGVPIIIKDNMAVRGMPASWGTRSWQRAWS